MGEVALEVGSGSFHGKMDAFVGSCGWRVGSRWNRRLISRKRAVNMRVATQSQGASVRISELRVTLRSPQGVLGGFGVAMQPTYGVEDVLNVLEGRGVAEKDLARAEIVADVLKDLQMDNETVMAGVMRGMPVTESEIEEIFGGRAVEILRREREFRASVDMFTSSSDAGTTKLTYLAMFGDASCLVIELAHAVANVRLLAVRDKRKRTKTEMLREILSVYIPLADTLGCWALQSELEELAFMHLYPEAYEKMCELVGDRLQQYGALLGCSVRDMEYTLSNMSQFQKVASFRVSGRIKNCFSIYQKMQRKQLSFEDVLDFVALRVILKPKSGVSEEEACYKVLEEVKRKWKSVEGTTRDYIANPKENGYQSLHTTILASGLPVEIQIRTERMHECSEIGSAAHHSYKIETLLDF